METVNTNKIGNGTARRVAAATLGCKVNLYDTQAMLELFENSGYEVVEFSELADIYIINTCTVTNLGDKKSRQLIRRAKRQNPKAIIAAAGCYSQVASEEVSQIKGINIVIGTKNRSKIVDIVEAYKYGAPVLVEVSDIFTEKTFERLKIEKLRNHTRAYLKIQEGCDRFCSYCIIPYARGAVRSRAEEDILNEVNMLALNGFKEIVMAGINVALYGKDLGDIDFLGVLRKVSKVEGIERIRFSSIEPQIITKGFVEGIKEMPKICDHFHLSLQSGCNATLERMNRKYVKEEYAQAVDMIRSNYKDAAITTDVIVGFPGETEGDFLESCDFVTDMRLAKIHVFPFSPKKGTKAYSMEGRLQAKEKEARANEMNRIAEELRISFMRNFSQRTMKVLFEKMKNSEIKESNNFIGYTTNYIEVSANSDYNLENKVVPVNLFYNEKENSMHGLIK